MTTDFVNVTEIEGQRISEEQLHRTCHRYHWAASLASGRDVLEVACGAGQGLGILRAVAKTLVAGDISPQVLASAQACFADTVPLGVFGAEDLPFADASFDLVLLFEALYYVSNPSAFFAEARRVLRPGGQLLIATANKDLYDFTPSPFSHRYLGVMELAQELGDAGFSTRFSGHIDTSAVSLRQRVLRPAKFIASKLGLIPKTMQGKESLKKLFFGQMAVMPADLTTIAYTYHPATQIATIAADRQHKVIYCEASLTS